MKVTLRVKGKLVKAFFEKLAFDQSYNENFYTLLLEFIIKNNLSFFIINKKETKALIEFLNPDIKQIIYKTLISDLK